MNDRRKRTFDVMTEVPDTRMRGCIVTYGSKRVTVRVKAATVGQAKLKVLAASKGRAPIYDIVEVG